MRLNLLTTAILPPVTVEFGSFDSDNFMNLSLKHRKIFIAIKILNPSASVIIGHKVITNPVEFPIGEHIH